MAENKPAKKVVKKATTPKKTVKKSVKKTTTKKVAVKKKAPTKKPVAKKAVTKKETVQKIVEKKNSAKKIKELGLWSRFYKVFTPNFLDELGAQKSHGKSWVFWFLSNFLLLLVPIISFFVFQGSFFKNFPDNLVDKIPTNEELILDTGESYNIKSLVKNFEFSIDSKGKLTSKNIPDPVIFLATDEIDGEGKGYTNLESMTEEFAEFAFVLDTKGEFDIENSGKKFANYFYFLGDRTIIHDGRKMQTTDITYKEVMADAEVSSFPMSFGYEDIKKAKPALVAFSSAFFMVIMLFLYLFLAVFRILNALIWGLLFYGIGSVFKVKKWSFERSFMAMLHFSFVTILLYPVAIMLGISSFVNALILLSILFGMNFWAMKKD